MIHVLATITTKTGMRTSVLEAFQANVPNVLTEQGCIEYGATVDVADAGPVQSVLGPDTFVVVEKWESLDALKAHMEAPHMKAYAERVRDLLESRVIHVLEPVGA